MALISPFFLKTVVSSNLLCHHYLAFSLISHHMYAQRTLDVAFLTEHDVSSFFQSHPQCQSLSRNRSLCCWIAIQFSSDLHRAKISARDTRSDVDSRTSCATSNSNPSSAAYEFLSNSNKCQTLTGSHIGNPRGTTPVPDWLEKWERNWQTLTGEREPKSKYRAFLIFIAVIAHKVTQPSPKCDIMG